MRIPYASQRGSVSLLALLIMLAIAAIGLGVAFIVLTGVKATQDFSSSLRAYYGSETALEKALDTITERRFAKADLSDTLAEVAAIEGAIGVNSADYRVTRATNDEVDDVRFDLGWQETKSVDLFDPDNPTSVQGSDVGSVRVEWNDTCGGSSWLEITAVEWTNIWDDSDTAFPEKYYYSCHFSTPQPGSTAVCAAVSNTPFTEAGNYQIRMKSTSEKGNDCSVTDAQLQAYAGQNASGSVKKLRNHIVVTAEGKNNHTKQILSATMPWAAPASGLLDYVLFSEEVITKE